jgi:hypothetical protein
MASYVPAVLCATTNGASSFGELVQINHGKQQNVRITVTPQTLPIPPVHDFRRDSIDVVVPGTDGMNRRPERSKHHFYLRGRCYFHTGYLCRCQCLQFTVWRLCIREELYYDERSYNIDRFTIIYGFPPILTVVVTTNITNERNRIRNTTVVIITCRYNRSRRSWRGFGIGNPRSACVCPFFLEEEEARPGWEEMETTLLPSRKRRMGSPYNSNNTGLNWRTQERYMRCLADDMGQYSLEIYRYCGALKLDGYFLMLEH